MMSDSDGYWTTEAEKEEEIDQKMRNIMYPFAGIVVGICLLFLIFCTDIL
jgi:hypothetical protein